MSETTNKAVFLSYASQDAEAAKRICEALRAAGVEVWFDQSELAGGDAWDAKIRGQISSCGLFVPVISAHTQARLEGYFRLEWKLAAQRTHTMADEKTFLLPIVIDTTHDAEAKVPPEFKTVQWTKLPAGEAPLAFAARVRKLLANEVAAESRVVPGGESRARSGPPKWWWLAPIFGITMALLLMMKESRPDASARSSSPPAAPALAQARQLAGRALLFRSLNGLTRERLGAAEDLLEQALKIDPLESEVWAVGAQVDVLMVYRGWDNSDVRRQSAAKRVARALALAPDGFESRHAQAVLAAFLVQTPEALAEAETANRALLREQPENRDLLEELGTCLQRLDRYDDASEVFQRAGRPVLVGWASYSARRFEETRRIADGLLAEKRTAEALILKATVELFGFNDRAAAQAAINRLTPTELREDDAAGIALRLAVLSSNAAGILKLLEPFPHPFVSINGVDYPRQYWTGIARMLQRQPEAAEIEWHGALQAIEERLKAKPDDEFTVGWACLLHARLGDKAGTERTIRLYGNYADLTDGQWDWNYCLAVLCLGDRNDEVIARLEKTMRNPNQRFNYVLYAWARFSPEFEPVRGNPRFEKLLRDTLPQGAKPFDDPKPAAEGVKIDDKSVAVLAFANLSDDKANEYFSDGISEELLNVLAKIPGLKVTARTSSFHFKGKDTSVPEIAQQLGVAYVVEGSVRKSGDKVRITAQLIKAVDGFHVWSDTFTRDLKDIFAVQDEIAGLIAQNLEIKMGVVAATQTVDPEAYRLYLEALPAITLRTLEGYDRAEQLLTRAVERDPSLVPAQAALAVVWSFRAQEKSEMFSADNPAVKRIVAQAEMAMRLGPGWAEAQAACGLVYGLTLRFAESEQFLRRAMQINPSYAPAHLWLGRILLNTGRMDEALAELKHATELDPLSHRALDNYAFALLDAGQPRAALKFVDRALQLQADSAQALEVRAAALARTGRLAEALGIVDAKRAESIGDLEYTIEVYASARRSAELEALLTASPRIRDLDRFYALAALGRADEALAELKSTPVDLGFMDLILFSPLLDPMRRDPRFQAKLESIGAVESHARAQAWRAAHPPEAVHPR